MSKEAFRKIRYRPKQDMWRVYKHTGKDKDYEVYKEALNEFESLSEILSTN